MTYEIVVAGFGGQGVLLAGKLLCVAAMRQGRYVSHIPSYGAEMRGGTANCSVVISDEEIASPVIEHPGIVIALNEPSLAKFLPRMRLGGLLVWNSSLVKTSPERDDITSVAIDATGISGEEGSDKGANMAALGVLLFCKPDLVNIKAVETALDEVVSARNIRHNPVNRRIIHRGLEFARGIMQEAQA